MTFKYPAIAAHNADDETAIRIIKSTCIGVIILNCDPTKAAIREPIRYWPSTPILNNPILKPTATAIAEMYNGIDRFIIETIDLPLVPYSNIIWNVSMGSLPIKSRINELNPNEIAKAISGAEKLAIRSLSFIFLIQSCSHLDPLEIHYLI